MVLMLFGVVSVREYLARKNGFFSMDDDYLCLVFGRHLGMCGSKEGCWWRIGGLVCVDGEGVVPGWLIGS